MNREDALKKVKKCMALGRSAEPHEAAAAMRQAQKLMEQFQIGERELSMIDVSEVETRASCKAVTVWEAKLSGIVAEAFGCEHYTRTNCGYDGAGNWFDRRLYIFVGLDASPTLAGYTFEVLTRQCAKARLAHIGKQPKRVKAITKTARGDEFAKGWVAGVAGLVERFAQPQRDEALLLEYMGARHPDMADAKTRDRSKRLRRNDWGHLTAGHEAGQAARLDRGVGGKQAQGLLK